MSVYVEWLIHNADGLATSESLNIIYKILFSLQAFGIPYTIFLYGIPFVYFSPALGINFIFDENGFQGFVLSQDIFLARMLCVWDMTFFVNLNIITAYNICMVSVSTLKHWTEHVWFDFIITIYEGDIITRRHIIAFILGSSWSGIANMETSYIWVTGCIFITHLARWVSWAIIDENDF